MKNVVQELNKYIYIYSHKYKNMIIKEYLREYLVHVMVLDR